MIVKTGQYIKAESGEYKISASSDSPELINVQISYSRSCMLLTNSIDEIIAAYNKILKIDISPKKIDDVELSVSACISTRNVTFKLIGTSHDTKLMLYYNKDENLRLPHDNREASDLILALLEVKKVAMSWSTSE